MTQKDSNQSETPGWDGERVQRRLSDLARFAAEAKYLTAKGKAAYLDDSLDGALLRGAGERILIKVATVVEKLPQAYKDTKPEIEWVSIGRMRNLIAHHYDHINDELTWAALENRIPKLAASLGLTVAKYPVRTEVESRGE